MLLAELVCSDDACDLTIDVIADERELEVLVCDGCGCCLQVVSLSEVEALTIAAVAETIQLRPRREARLRDAA